MSIRQLDSDWFEAQAPAKLNLFLEVRGKRDDGFHELETVMCGISLMDTIWFQVRRATDALSLEILPAREDIPADESNLLLRAVRQIQRAYDVTEGAQLRLFKRIPSQAGLGGGSADAAAGLLLANHAWRLGLSQAELLSHAARLGSDVSFFLGESPAICRGRGERLEPYRGSIPRHWVVVKPRAGLATAAVYRQLRLETESLRTLPDQLSAQSCFNRLQQPALELCPELEETPHRMRDVGLVPLMSGSGSAFFAECSGRRRGLRLANALRQRGEREVYVAHSLVNMAAC